MAQFLQRSNKNKTSIDFNSIKIQDRKGKQIKSEIEADIHKQNLMLLMKMHHIESKIHKKANSSFHLDSLNIKNRMDTFKKIQNENYDLIKRLRSQKSRYCNNQFEQQFKKSSSVSRSIRKTQKNFFKNSEAQLPKSKSIANDFQMLPQPIDGFNDRLIVYTQILNIKHKSCHLEISKNNSFYYILLQEFSNQRYFKLRLIINTGNHLIELIKKDQINFAERIIKKCGTYMLLIPYFPFIRTYTFCEYKKQSDFLIPGQIQKSGQTKQEPAASKLKTSQNDEKEIFFKELQESFNLRDTNNNQTQGSYLNKEEQTEEKMSETQYISNFLVQKLNDPSEIENNSNSDIKRK